jgi:hypothetical protein
MANPNILNSTSVKYHSIDVILDTQLFTPSSTLTSDYQTKNIVLRNNVNSGKVFKITRIALSNQKVGGRNGPRSFYLTYITDYTDSSIGDTSLGYFTLYGESRIFILSRDIDVNTTPYNITNTYPVLPPIEDWAGGSGFLFHNCDHFYMKEGAALECYATAGGYTLEQGPPNAEYYRGRARIHINYEEYEA